MNYPYVLIPSYFYCRTVPQKEHWWQVKHPPVELNEAPPMQNQPNQVAVAIPLINQKVKTTYSIIIVDYIIFV